MDGLNPDVEFEAPFSTVSVVLDYDKGTMDIFTETDPHPVDWDLACKLMERLGIVDLDEPDYLAGINTWHIQLKQ